MVPLTAADLANEQMVDRIIAEGALWSSNLIAAFRATPRHRFLPAIYVFLRKQHRWKRLRLDSASPDDLRLVYTDRALITRLSSSRGGLAPVPISSSSQPSLMAQMLEDLKLSQGLSVLEIGAGTGYNSALLAQCVGPGRVLSVDVDRDVLAQAADNLHAFSERYVTLQRADGRCGVPKAAPFDRIMVTAATPDLEPAWLDQLAERGLLLAPLALAPGLAFVVRGSVTSGVFHGRLTRAAYFMPLRSEGETGSSDVDSLPNTEPLRTLPAPWAGWFDRRRQRPTWMSFCQALAFFGWVRGLGVHYRALTDAQPSFGISDDSALCWFSPQEWQVSGDAGRDFGMAHWRAFLDAGGPWPTEFRFKASPDVTPTPNRPGGFHRQGLLCRQVWELSEPRDRMGWI